MHWVESRLLPRLWQLCSETTLRETFVDAASSRLSIEDGSFTCGGGSEPGLSLAQAHSGLGVQRFRQHEAGRLLPFDREGELKPGHLVRSSARSAQGRHEIVHHGPGDCGSWGRPWSGCAHENAAHAGRAIRMRSDWVRWSHRRVFRGFCRLRSLPLEGPGRSEKRIKAGPYEWRKVRVFKGLPNIRLNCGASASEQPQPPESAGAAGIDLSVEVTTAAQPGDIQRGSTISAKIEARSAA
jgi:hypothetical protein